METKKSYETTKEQLLHALGRTRTQSMEDLFNPLKAVNATPGEVDLKASALTRRLFKEAKTKEDCLWLVQKINTYVLYP